jgi:hypothetical protein
MDEMPKILGAALVDSDRHFGDQCWVAPTPLGPLYIERFGKSWKAHLQLASFGDTMTTEPPYTVRGDNWNGDELRQAAAIVDAALRELLTAAVEPIAAKLNGTANAVELAAKRRWSEVRPCCSATYDDAAETVRAFYAEEPSR